MQARTDTGGATGPLLKFMDFIYSLCIWISGAALIAMTIIIPLGIIQRYFFGSGAAWAEPIAILCMVTFTFVGAAASYRAGSHLAVTLVTDRLPESWQKVAAFIVKLLMVLICLFLVWYGTKLCLRLWEQPIAEYPALTSGKAYSPLPLGSALTLLFVLESIFFGSQARRPVVRLGAISEEQPAAQAE